MTPAEWELIVLFALKFGLDAAIAIGKAKNATLQDAIAALELAKTKTADDYVADAELALKP